MIQILPKLRRAANERGDSRISEILRRCSGNVRSQKCKKFIEDRKANISGVTLFQCQVEYLRMNVNNIGDLEFYQAHTSSPINVCT